MSKETILTIRGKLHWAKLTGDARPYTGNPKYDKGPYWSVDITPDAKSRKLIAEAGISEKLREPKGEKETRKETFITLKQLLKKADGSNNKPPKIINIQNQPWGEALLGNETIADIKVKVKDYGSGSEKGVYLQAVRVLQHVPYEGGAAFEELSEDDEFFAAATEGLSEPDSEGNSSYSDQLDDEVPF